MKIKLIRPATVTLGAGQIVDVSEQTAQRLERSGRAVLVKSGKKAEKPEENKDKSDGGETC